VLRICPSLEDELPRRIKYAGDGELSLHRIRRCITPSGHVSSPSSADLYITLQAIEGHPHFGTLRVFERRGDIVSSARSEGQLGQTIVQSIRKQLDR
jgi:hypothetical protein